MNDTTQSASPESAVVPQAVALVCFGLMSGKAHASRFEPVDAVLAEKAAGLMGLRVLRLETGEQQELGAKLPAGRVFSSGKIFAPFIKGALLDQLNADPAAFTPPRPPEAEVPVTAPRKVQGGRSVQKATDAAPSGETAASGPAAPPTDQGAIAVGHRVLAAEENAPEVWYLATVTALKGEKLLQLMWASAEWAGEPPFVRHRDHLALLPAAVAATLK